MLIRPAEITDAPALAVISLTSWRATYTDILPKAFFDALSVEQREKSWRDRLSHPDDPGFTFVAENENGEVIGYAGGLPERTGNTEYTGELGDIYVLEAYQRRGAGRLLAANIVDRLIQRGFDSMLVWVFSSNPYRAFYESLGGVEIDSKEEEFAGVSIPETAYGWKDLRLFNA